ncbi:MULTISPECIES: GAP1-N2 domain-containing protein [unclassified Blastococcus]
MLRGQFTYTASSRPGVWDTHPGWKVQSVAEVPGGTGLGKDVVSAAARNVGGFAPPAIPELASRADVQALPRCLRLDLLDDELVCVSHLVAAGPDYSGRPNFFAHGLVVEPGSGFDADEDAEEGIVRPADLWDAEVWLRPVGAQQVEAAEPRDDLHTLQPGRLGDAELEEFVKAHPNQRDFVLAAIERAVDGGGPLVLVGDHPESVVHWLRLVGSLLLPAAVWRLPFSTYERIQETETPAAWRFAAVGVPSTDMATAARLPGTRFAVLDDEGSPVRAAAGRWMLPDGSELVAGEWSRLAEVVVLTGLLPAVAEQLEWLADELGDSTIDEPLWALGAAVLLVDDLPWDTLAEDAAALVLGRWPRDLDSGAVVPALLERVRLQRSASEIVAALQRRSAGAPTGLSRQLVFLEPVREALASPAAFWRSDRALPRELPDLGPAAREELDQILAAALDWAASSGAVGPRALLEMARLVDSASDVRGRMGIVARQLITPRLLEPELNPRQLKWPPMSAWLWHHIRPALAEDLRRGQESGQDDPGKVLSQATHEWLSSISLPTGPLTAIGLRGTGPVEWELAAYRTFRRRPGAPSRFERAAAFLSVVNNAGYETADRAVEALRAAYGATTGLSAGELAILIECAPQSMPFARIVVELLGKTAPSAESAALAAQLLAREELTGGQERVLARHLAVARRRPAVRQAPHF